MMGTGRRNSLAVLLLFTLAAYAQGQDSSAVAVRAGLDERGAVVRNLALPGWGFKHLDRVDLARSALVREASLWIGYGLLVSAANWYRQDFRAYAAEHAGADFTERPDIYYYRVARFPSMDDYNQEMLRQRNLSDVYPQGFGWEWSWDDSARMDNFEQLRANSLLSAKAARFALGGLIVNRVVAAMQVLFVTRRQPTVSAYLAPLDNGTLLLLNIRL